MDTVFHDRNLWILLCFATYLGPLFVFAAVYFSQYRQSPDRFGFGRSIEETKLRTVTASTERQIELNSAEIELLELIEDRFKKGDTVATLAAQGLRGPLPSGRNFAFYSLPAQSTSSPPQDIVETRDSKDNRLSAIGVPKGWPWQRRDEIFARRRAKLENQIRAFQRRLRMLSTTTHDIWSFWDFLYFSTITQTTVGFGDILPNSTMVRMVVAIQIALGYAIVVFFLNLAFRP